MAMQDDLLAIERKLWSGGSADYRATLDDACLMAFATMGGVSSRDDIVKQVEGARWHDVGIELEGFLQPTADVALLTYRASAKRGEHERYRARASSGYVRRGGEWKMMFHQQTPLAPAQSSD